MKEYYLTTFETKYGDFFQDYLTNKQKRFQTFLQGEDFWKTYVSTYKWAKEQGILLLRAKVIEGNEFTLFQIWESEQSRKEFDSKVDEDYFLENFKFEYTRSNKTINEKQKLELIKQIMSSNSILQWVHPDHRVTGMTIGDPLKNDSLVTV